MADGFRITHNILGLYIKTKIYRDIDYVEQYYNLDPVFYDMDGLPYENVEDSDSLIKI